MKTKAFVRFLNRVNYLDIDIEFIDIVIKSTKNGLLSDKSDQRLFEKLNPE